MGALSLLSRFARAALLAAVVGAAALTAAVPAQAMPYMHNHFPGGPYFGRPFFHPYPFFPIYPYPVYPGPVCLSDWQVRNAISGAGYYNVSINQSGPVFVQATGIQGRWRYFITFNRCSGNIVGVTR